MAMLKGQLLKENQSSQNKIIVVGVGAIGMAYAISLNEGLGR